MQKMHTMYSLVENYYNILISIQKFIFCSAAIFLTKTAIKYNLSPTDLENTLYVNIRRTKMHGILSAAGTGLQISSVVSAFTLASAGAAALPVAAICGTGYLAGHAMKMD